MKKLLFPPIVPNSLPAFNKDGTLRYYFKPSVTNSVEQFNHLQMTVVKMDTNKTVLSKADYPFEIKFFTKKEIGFNELNNFYYVDVPGRLFPLADVPYKVQIRLGEDKVEGFSQAQLGEVLKKLDSMSEWSIVSYILPITIPEFGIQGFDEGGKQNNIDSTGFQFNGFYNPKDRDKKETLKSYQYVLLTEGGKTIMSTEEFIVGGTNFPNLSYTFPVELKPGHKYKVCLKIKTRNLYTAKKEYLVYSATAPELDLFSSLEVVPNLEEGGMDIEIRARQILMEVKKNSKLAFLKDEPGYQVYPDLPATHLKLEGTIFNQDDFQVTEKDGAWICQLKAFFSNPKKSLQELIDNPTIELYQKTPIETDSDYFTKIKIGVLKINLAYPTLNNPDPEPEWEYRFMVRKEILNKENGKENVLLSQNKFVRRKNFSSKQEYYMFIKEENGLLDVKVKETYKSKNAKI